MPHDKDEHGVSRFDRLQASVEALTRDVADTAATVRSLAGSVGAIAQRQDRLEGAQRDLTRLNWAPVAIMASVVVSVATLSGGLIAYAISAESQSRVTGDQHLAADLGGIEARLDRIEERSVTETTRLDAELSQRFADIDAVLQREMRLLDEILQREMGLHVKRLDQRLDRLERPGTDE